MPRFSNVMELLDLRAQSQSADRGFTFLADGETEKEHYSYGELDRRAREIGALLQGFELAGRQVLLVYQPGLEFLAAFFGYLYAEVVAIPADPPRTNRHSPRIHAILDDADVQMVLTSSVLLPKLKSSAHHGSKFPELSLLATDTLPNEPSISWEIPKVSGDTLAFLQYTSGSTVSPKRGHGEP